MGMAAAEHGHLEIVEALCEAGAQLTRRTSSGLTAVAAAEQGGHMDVEDYLLNRMKDAGQTEDSGCSWPVFITLLLSVGVCLFFGWLTHWANQQDKRTYHRQS